MEWNVDFCPAAVLYFDFIAADEEESGLCRDIDWYYVFSAQNANSTAGDEMIPVFDISSVSRVEALK